MKHTQLNKPSSFYHHHPPIQTYNHSQEVSVKKLLPVTGLNIKPLFMTLLTAVTKGLLSNFMVPKANPFP